jgi:hypothetical protein
MAKHRRGKLKVEHTLLEGLEEYINKLSGLDVVSAIIPGRISRQNSGRGSKGLFIKYRTTSGYKLLYKNGTSVQELFVVSSKPDEFERLFKELFT